MVQCMNTHTQLIDLCHCSIPKENEKRVRKRVIFQVQVAFTKKTFIRKSRSIRILK